MCKVVWKISEQKTSGFREKKQWFDKQTARPLPIDDYWDNEEQQSMKHET